MVLVGAVKRRRNIRVSSRFAFLVVYNWDHYFRLGPIQKPEVPNWPILSSDTITNTKTEFQRKDVVTDIQWYFFIITGTLKPNLLPNIQDFLIIFEDLCSISRFSKLMSPRQKKWEKFQKVSVLEKKNSVSILIQKLDLGFGSQYQNLASVPQ